MTAGLAIDDRETRLTQRRYDRIAPIYDTLGWMMEWRARRWRRDLWSRVKQGRVLDVLPQAKRDSRRIHLRT